MTAGGGGGGEGTQGTPQPKDLLAGMLEVVCRVCRLLEDI